MQCVTLGQALRGFLGTLLVLAGLGAGSLVQAEVDPPGRVGRLNLVQGPVSLSPAGSDEWVEARTTRPLTSGDQIWMGQRGRSELSIGSAVLRADEESSLKILQLDDDQAQFELSEGTLAVQVRGMDPDDRLEIATPNLAFVVDRPGDYRIQVDPDRNTTQVTVRRGAGTAHADDGQHSLEAPSHARFSGVGLDRVSDGLPPEDGFDRWVEDRIAYARSRESARYLSRDMVGYEDLDDHGSWREEPGYGWIWAPRITIAAWAPYRYGHWAWIAPWGWTWVDDAPWGFAPFHYGRWAYLHSHWVWVPGPVVRRPYYAPALVSFIGSPGGWSLRVSSAPAVAWYPLGPGDHYRPVYRSSTTYITRINRTVVVVKDGDRPRSHGHFDNRRVPGATTALPARAFVEGRPVHRDMLRVAERDLAQARDVGTMPSLAPVRSSLIGRQDRRMEPPPRRDGGRPVIATRTPAPPAVERDDLARRFAREGNHVRDAGPALADDPRRSRGREERAVRVVDPTRRGEGPRDPRPTPRAEPSDFPDRTGVRPETRERPGREPRLDDRREQQPERREQPFPRPARPEGAEDSPRDRAPQARPEAERPSPSRREESNGIEHRLPPRPDPADNREAARGGRAERETQLLEPRRPPERPEANRPPQIRREASPEPQASEGRDANRFSRPEREAQPSEMRRAPDRPEFNRPPEMRREAPPEMEPRRAQRPAPPPEVQGRPEREDPRNIRQMEELRPREAPREIRAEHRVQERPRPEAPPPGAAPQNPRREEAERSRPERGERERERERQERGHRPPGQAE